MDKIFIFQVEVKSSHHYNLKNKNLVHLKTKRFLRLQKHLIHHELHNVTSHSKICKLNRFSWSWYAYLTRQYFPCFVDIECLSSKEPGTLLICIHTRYVSKSCGQVRLDAHIHSLCFSSSQPKQALTCRRIGAYQAKRNLSLSSLNIDFTVAKLSLIKIRFTI